VPKATDAPRPFWNLETRLAVALLLLAGLVGAAAYTHSAGYFVTFMTGNTERAVIGGLLGDSTLALGGLNTSFVKNGETAIPVTYVTGTLVTGRPRRRWR
jgi:uncharacterized membrane protein YoaK (UPF0700 family)